MHIRVARCLREPAAAEFRQWAQLSDATAGFRNAFARIVFTVSWQLRAFAGILESFAGVFNAAAGFIDAPAQFAHAFAERFGSIAGGVPAVPGQRIASDFGGAGQP
jgi:hypothetical protein